MKVAELFGIQNGCLAEGKKSQQSVANSYQLYSDKKHMQLFTHLSSL